MFVAIASISVVGPVVAYLVAPEEAAGALGHLKEFMVDNNAVLVMIVLRNALALLRAPAKPGLAVVSSATRGWCA